MPGPSREWEAWVPNTRSDAHLDERDTAAYVDGCVGGEDLALMDAHLSICRECRAEVLEVSSILRTSPRVGRLLRHLWANRS